MFETSKGMGLLYSPHCTLHSWPQWAALRASRQDWCSLHSGLEFCPWLTSIVVILLTSRLVTRNRLTVLNHFSLATENLSSGMTFYHSQKRLGMNHWTVGLCQVQSHYSLAPFKYTSELTRMYDHLYLTGFHPQFRCRGNRGSREKQREE